MAQPLISIIIPVYNTGDCLEKCVDSCLAQTYGSLEILLIDDGSDDGTGALCDELQKKDKRIRVFHKKNGGSSSARNLGIREARGEYLGFVDSDDYIGPKMYERLMGALPGGRSKGPAFRREAMPDGGDKRPGGRKAEALIAEASKSGAVIAQISRDEIDAGGNRLPDVCIPPEKPVFCPSGDFLRELLLHRADCSFCTKLVPRSLLQGKGFPEGRLNEDFFLLIRLLPEIDGIHVLPQQDYHVYYRIGSNTRKKDAGDFSRVFMDIVDNADAVRGLVDGRYPALKQECMRFGLYQRLDYLLHIPIGQMNRENEFYNRVKKFLRSHIGDTIMNPYLSKKNKAYLLLLTAAPRTVRRAHRWKMQRESSS